MKSSIQSLEDKNWLDFLESTANRSEDGKWEKKDFKKWKDQTKRCSSLELGILDMVRIKWWWKKHFFKVQKNTLELETRGFQGPSHTQQSE
jgi:hypothetical protein